MNMLLNGGWTMLDGEKRYACQVPCSAYDTLLKNQAIEDPYWGENEWISTSVSDRDFTFENTFSLPEAFASAPRLFLTFQGIDTLAHVYLNGTLLGSTDNMHRTWEYAVEKLIRPGENILRLQIHSPTRYIAQKQAQRPLWGAGECMPGFPHLRKAHCMFGWDWGPKLPDMGIWRDVRLSAYEAGRIRGVYYTQRHDGGQVELSCQADIEAWAPGLEAVCAVLSPAGESYSAPLQNGRAKIVIERPQLWWVRGLGDQPLYTCRVELRRNGQTVDVHERKIGLRTLTISQEKDQWGKEFCFINNGVKVFAMGSNYIPEDQILPRCTAERTVKLLNACKDANHNFIRVWGGGMYPGDAFYDWCDENGFIVWQDCMFACAAYRLTPEFEATVRAEIRDNAIRLRNHPSLGMWCGNNEIESAWEGWGLPEDPEARQDYLTLFERDIPSILKEYDPETFYWPSSPSSGGGIRDTSSNLAGDMHYWAVWHNFKPIEAFREFYYRFCSEYGFESLPDIKTFRAFARDEDLDLCGNVIQAHQKCVQGNEKVMYYLAQMVNYPYDFERLIYCSQLVQADCIRSNVEHMRRARGRCMGSSYWQVNDSNPVISWSSIDYFGRWKGLHYASRRFYAPLLVSCDDTDPAHPVLYVTNDTPRDESLLVVCHLRNSKAEIIKGFTASIQAKALSAKPCLSLDVSAEAGERQAQRTLYLEYVLLRGSQAVSAGTTLFVRPKAFDFLPAHLSVQVEDRGGAFAVTLRSDCFTKSVCLSLRDFDCVFSDNWFDVHGDEPVTVLAPKTAETAALSAAEFERQLQLRWY